MRPLHFEAEDAYDDIFGYISGQWSPDQVLEELPEIQLDPGGALKPIKESSKLYLINWMELAQLRSNRDSKFKDINQAEDKVKARQRNLEDLQQMLLHLQEANGQRGQELEAAQIRLASLQEQEQKKMAPLEEYIKKTEENMGLKVHVTSHGSLVLSFKNLGGLKKSGNVSNSLCEITVVSTNSSSKGCYKVLHCMPQLEPAQVSDMEKCLNKTQDLSGFICTVRKALNKAANKKIGECGEHESRT